MSRLTFDAALEITITESRANGEKKKKMKKFTSKIGIRSPESTLPHTINGYLFADEDKFHFEWDFIGKEFRDGEREEVYDAWWWSQQAKIRPRKWTPNEPA